MRLLILTGMAIGFSITCLAANLTNTSGTVYSNVEIKRAEPDALVVMGNKGIMRVPFDELSKDLQVKYGYNPTNAAKFLSYKAKNAEAYNRSVVLQQQRKREMAIESDRKIQAALAANQPKVVQAEKFENNDTRPIVAIEQNNAQSKKLGDVSEKMSENVAIKRIGQ